MRYFNANLSCNAKCILRAGCRDDALSLHCGTRADWIGTVPSLARPRRANSDEHNGRNQGPRRAAAVAAPANLPADADDDDVDRASHHRHWPVFRNAAGGLVADRRRRPERLCALRMVRRFLDRPADPVRLYLGADPSHAGRRPPSDLGYRPRLRPERARMARRRQPDRLDRDHACCCGSSASSPWEARDERTRTYPHAARRACAASARPNPAPRISGTSASPRSPIFR